MLRRASYVVLLALALLTSALPAQQEPERASPVVTQLNEGDAAARLELLQTLAQYLAESLTGLTGTEAIGKVWTELPGCVDRDPPGVGAPTGIPGLAAPIAKLLGDENPEEVRRLALVAAMGLGPEGQALGPALVGCLSSPDAAFRRNAVVAIHVLQIAGPEVTAALIDLLADPEAPVRAAAAATLGSGNRGPANEAIQALLACLADADEGVRWRSMKAIGALGPPAEQVPELLAALDDPSPCMRRQLGIALGHLVRQESPPGVEDSVRKLLGDDAPCAHGLTVKQGAL